MVAGVGTGVDPINGGVPTGTTCAVAANLDMTLGAAGVFGEPANVGDAGTAGSGAVAVGVDGPGPADA